MPENHLFKLPDAFRIHFNGIDAEHEGLVDMLNGWMRTSSGEYLENFEAKLGGFIVLMKQHFMHEESHMRNLGYAGLQWHTDHHTECCDKIEGVLERCRRDGYADMRAIRSAFQELINDVARADLKFAEFLEGRNAD